MAWKDEHPELHKMIEEATSSVRMTLSRNDLTILNDLFFAYWEHTRPEGDEKSLQERILEKLEESKQTE